MMARDNASVLFAPFEKELSMTTRTKAVDDVAYVTGRPRTSINPALYVQLQGDELLPRGGPGGIVDLSATHLVTLFLAAALNRPHGISPGQNVKRWRALPLTGTSGIDLAHTFGIDTTDAGRALDSIVANVRTWPGRSQMAEAKAGGEIGVAAEFHYDTYMVLVFYGLQAGKKVAQLTFGTQPPEEAERIERVVAAMHGVFLRLAVA
jgi:hypothetical protein